MNQNCIEQLENSFFRFIDQQTKMELSKILCYAGELVCLFWF